MRPLHKKMATPDRKPLSFFSLLVDHRPVLTSPIVDPSFIMRKSAARMLVKRTRISYPFFGKEIKLVYIRYSICVSFFYY